MDNNLILKFFTQGFYPEDLPQEFCVSGVTDEFIHEFIVELDCFDEIRQGRKNSELIQFTVPKNSNSRRWFHLLNPLHFIRLSHSLQCNWERITQFCATSTLSTSRITISEHKYKLFHKGPFRESTRERISRSAGKKLMLSMDITNFYPSIYTHSLEWVLESRRLNGSERWNREFLGVLLDQDIRCSQSGKTNGIPIGPETSRVISEIIGSYLDGKLLDIGIDISGTRYVDDYHLYFNNHADLELARTTLQIELNKLNLASNEAKSEVTTIPEIFEPSWVQSMTKLEFRTSEIGFQKDLISAFSVAFQNAKNHPKDFSIKFLISMLVRKEFNYSPESKELLFELLRHSIEQDARTISRAFQLLYKVDGFGTGEKFKKLFESKLIFDSKLGKTYEVLWILHGYRKLNIEPPKEAIKNIIDQSDILCLTYILLMSEKGLVSLEAKGEIINFIEESLSGNQDPFLTSFWLPLYEGSIRGWWDIKCEKPAFVLKLQEYGVSFLSTDEDWSWEDFQFPSYPEEADIQFDEDEMETDLKY